MKERKKSMGNREVILLIIILNFIVTYLHIYRMHYIYNNWDYKRMGYRDLKKADKYLLVGHLLKKGIKKKQVNNLIKILKQKNPIDKMIHELMKTLDINSEKKQQEVIDKEIPLKKQTSSVSIAKKGTIVIAEKDPYYTRLLKNENIAQSYYIIHAENGIPGLKTIQKILPLLAIIDFDTYSISEKYESLKIIKRRYKNIPIIIICSIVPGDLNSKLNHTNEVSYVEKPINGRQLQQVIQKKLS